MRIPWTYKLSPRLWRAAAVVAADAAVAHAEAAASAAMERMDRVIHEADENNNDGSSLSSLYEEHIMNGAIIEGALEKAKKRAALASSMLQTGVNTQRNE